MITLKVKDLSKSFGSTEVLKKINIEIEEVEIIKENIIFKTPGKLN